jgi:signal transduction histidine kinase
LVVAFLDYLPRGTALSDAEFKNRHTLLQWVLFAHIPALLAFGLYRHFTVEQSIEAVAAPAAFLALSRVLRSRRMSALAVTAGLSSCSIGLVILSGGSIEAHFHFFILIGFIALYQDWVPFVWNTVFTTFSHGIGSWLFPNLVFSHVAGRNDPWTWALIHGVAVLAACAGVMLQLRFTEDDHQRTVKLRTQLVEGNRKRFTADLLVNLARRNQNLIYRQLELLNRLEDHERDAEQLSHLFQLDHLATRIRRNAESLLVLSGEEPARKWGGSVLLVDVVRAAIAEIEELDRVDFSVDESLAVSGRAVADATHLLAELIENAVHFSPPGLSVMIRTRPYLPSPGAHVLTIEDWGVGMSAGDLADANDLLRRPREVDLATSQRLGLHVVARLASRYGILCSVESTPGGGVTAVVVLPAELFAPVEEVRTPVGARTGPAAEVNGATTGSVNGHGLNGHGLNGHGLNGHGLNGHGVNGHGLNGHGVNGSVNGHGVNGSGHGHGVNGSLGGATRVDGNGIDGAAGKGTAGLLGPGPLGAADDHGATRVDPTGLPGLPGFGPRLSGPAALDGLSDLDGLDGLSALAGPGLGRRRVPGSALADDTAPADGTALADGPAFGDDTAVLDAGDTALPAPRPEPTRRDGSWSSWWPLPADATQAMPAPADGGLLRRTPQANLAEELRRDEQAEAAERPQRPLRDPAEARSALSRFQATQRAARQDARRDPGHEGTGRR